jgi:1-acyl-sn-glycerol-3-phosphate acyltransferase
MIEKSISGRPISAEKAQLRRRNLYNLLKFAFRLITKTKYEGVENIPSQGPFIMATNHISRLDTPVLFLNPVRPDITALVTTKYMDYPFMRWFVETGGGIWLDRTKADFSAFGQAAEILAQGRPLGIAPEGTRSTNSQLLEAKPGAVLLAHRTHSLIVPVGIVGTDTALPNLKHLRPAHITARFGKPFTLPPFSRDDREGSLKQQTDEIMCRIAALLPESHRGFYADHPRLKELLAETAGA